MVRPQSTRCWMTIVFVLLICSYWKVRVVQLTDVLDDLEETTVSAAVNATGEDGDGAQPRNIKFPLYKEKDAVRLLYDSEIESSNTESGSLTKVVTSAEKDGNAFADAATDSIESASSRSNPGKTRTIVAASSGVLACLLILSVIPVLRLKNRTQPMNYDLGVEGDTQSHSNERQKNSFRQTRSYNYSMPVVDITAISCHVGNNNNEDDVPERQITWPTSPKSLPRIAYSESFEIVVLERFGQSRQPSNDGCGPTEPDYLRIVKHAFADCPDVDSDAELDEVDAF